MVQTDTDRRMGLNLNLSIYSLSKPLSQFLDEVLRIKYNHSKLSEIDGYVGKLEEERKKMDVFKRELPLCMLLLNEAIGALQEEARKGSSSVMMASNGKFGVGEGAKLETDNKKNWMSSAQLWISNPNSQFQSTNEEEDRCVTQSPFNQGGAFLPFNPSPPPPPPPPPPADPELQKRIDKLVEYSVKNGPEFEAMMRDRQKDNPDYAFLFGGEGHGYYRYKQFLSMHPPGGPFDPPFPSASMPMIHHPPNPMMSPTMNNVPGPLGVPPVRQPPFPPFHDQQQLQQHHPQPHPFVPHARPDFDQSTHAFRGLSGPLPADVSMELNGVLANLNGTKESIKSAKIWFMQRSPFAPALAEALRDRVFAMDDSDRQMHIVYLANDILFDSLQRRTNLHEFDNEALAFRPVLGSMLGRIYHFPQNKEENQSRLEKILQFWASKEVFDQDTISSIDKEMKSGAPANTFSRSPIIAANSLQHTGMLQQPPSSNVPLEHLTSNPVAAQQFIPNVMPPGGFPGSIPVNPSVPPPAQPPAGEKPPPYPLFPPGLIPGMVRKMQIGIGVPYSPLSPLDIPTVIPPSDIPQSQVLESVSKFFKKIGEVNPSEGPMGSESQDDYEDYERDSPQRKGGACIPPPPNLQVDPETGTYADGSTDKKSTSGRLGLGATADPNEPTQYDDVYTSYRKHRSTNYHTSMSARSTTR